MDTNQVPQTPEAVDPRISAMLLKPFSLTFTQQEWIVIYNVLTGISYKLGDSRVVLPIIDKIQGVCAVDTNIVPKKEKKVKVA